MFFLNIATYYISFKRYFVTDNSLLKDYHLKVYLKSLPDLETNTFLKSLKLETS